MKLVGEKEAPDEGLADEWVSPHRQHTTARHSQNAW